MELRVPEQSSAMPPRINIQPPPNTEPKTPIDRGRRPPRLILPNSPNNLSPLPQNQLSSKTGTPKANPYVYPTNDGYEFMNELKGFAKSGMSIGEKSTVWMYNKLSAWSKKWFTHCFLSIVLTLYTFGGALLFVAIEGHGETIVVENIRDVRNELIENLKNLSQNSPGKTSDSEWMGSAANQLIKYEDFVMELYKNKTLLAANRGPKIWTMFNSVVYCATIYTTIGYGHIYPKTVTGQALTVVYAIIGIPLFLIALTDFGKLFTRCIKFVWSFVRRVYYTGSCRRARKTAHMEDILHGAQVMYEIATLRRPSIFTGGVPEETVDVENPKPVESPKPLDSATIGTDEPTTPALSHFEIDDEFNLPISLAIILLILYIFTGAVMYCLLEEEWNFFSAFYFVFISMSTIGFGDYVPTNPICVIASIFYLVFGLALMSMCINVVQVKLSDTFKDASAKLGATMGLEVHADGSASPVDCTDAPEEEVPETPVPDESTNLTTTESKLERKSSLRVPKEGNEENVKTTKEVKF